jgi:hypothetical protein
VTTPAAETKVIGLLADPAFGEGRRAVVMVFASQSGQFYHDGTTRRRLSGLTHLDNFIVTRKSCPFIGTQSSGQLLHDMTIPAHLPGLKSYAT